MSHAPTLREIPKASITKLSKNVRKPNAKRSSYEGGDVLE